VRAPHDAPATPARQRSGRARWWIVAAVVLLIAAFVSLKSLATLYTDSLWFTSVGFHRVWSTLLAVKIGLFASFGAIFFVLLWVNLVICDRLAARSPSTDPEDELVRRYQRTIHPYAGRLYAGISIVVALIAASGTVGQWNNWLLFTHSQSFGVKDPEFGLDVGFFVFKLPFLEFLVDWALVALVVVLVITAIFHYLNGGIRPQRSAPRVQPMVKVHLSVLLALIALVKAAGYVLQRYELDMSTNGYVEGAGYTDVHARLPALEVLFFISLFAAAILLYNIRRQGWTLPILAVGLWAFVALVIGVIYPAVLQALKVNPAQSTLEKPYIARNIKATRAAYGLDDVSVSRDADATQISVSTVDADITSLDDIRLWDPSSKISETTFQKKQDISAYYTIKTVQVDRYTVDGTLRPVVVGVREIDPTNLPSASWVNTHLQYTHGEGVVLAQANEATAKGNPVFTIDDVPPSSSSGYPKITQPAVYFGVTEPGFVVADTRQPELDSQKSTGADVESHYSGTGGVKMGSFLTRAAFAIRLGDLNLLLSNLITSQSKMMFVRSIRTMAEKAAPFLSFDSQPYAAIVHGHIDWILDGYTTTANYPYSQNADTEDVPSGSDLPSSYNYVRNSVVAVVNAYSGKMTLYAMDDDPILRAYESAFPHMFTPSSQMTVALRAHLRYGTDLFAIQAAMYGRYHITSPSQFYTAGDAWVVSPTTGVGAPDQTLQVTYVLNAQGQVVSGSYSPMSPIYQVLAEPGERTPSFTITDAYVPAGGGGSDTQVLRAFLVGNSNPGQFGQLRVYETPPGASKIGPVQADTEIEQTKTVSRTITLLNKEGSQVELGNILLVPVDQSLIYVRPLYVEAKTEPQPQLKYVIAVLGQTVKMETTLGATLDALLGTSLKSTSGTLTTTPTAPSTTKSATKKTPTPPSSSSASASEIAQAHADLAQAASDYTLAEADLKAGNLAGYQSEVTAAKSATAAAEQLLSTTGTGTSATKSSSSDDSGSGGSGSSGSGGSGSGGSGGTNSSSATSTKSKKVSTTTTTQPGET
jgi:uncharacterized protein